MLRRLDGHGPGREVGNSMTAGSAPSPRRRSTTSRRSNPGDACWRTPSAATTLGAGALGRTGAMLDEGRRRPVRPGRRGWTSRAEPGRRHLEALEARPRPTPDRVDPGPDGAVGERPAACRGPDRARGEPGRPADARRTGCCSSASWCSTPRRPPIPTAPADRASVAEEPRALALARPKAASAAVVEERLQPGPGPPWEVRPGGPRDARPANARRGRRGRFRRARSPRPRRAWIYGPTPTTWPTAARTRCLEVDPRALKLPAARQPAVGRGDGAARGRRQGRPVRIRPTTRYAKAAPHIKALLAAASTPITRGSATSSRGPSTWSSPAWPSRLAEGAGRRQRPRGRRPAPGLGPEAT